MRTFAAGAAAILMAVGIRAAMQADGAASCPRIASLKLSNAAITSAAIVDPGAFVPPATPGPLGPSASSAFADLPAFCRVAATLTPSSDSDIKIEVWLPTSNWNGKFEGVGNGGWSGNIAYGSLAAQLARGYATASTDTGHAGGRGSFALGHPEKLTDFAWRAVHEMTVQAKVIVRAYYDRAPRQSYWNGCSSGGKQGLKEAQRFPDDYDGIVAGAPANYWTHLMAESVWIAQASLKEPGSLILPAKYALVHQAVLDACDAVDGVKDGVLEDPRRCRFDPGSLVCKGDDGPTCLTPKQVETARAIYASARNPRTGAVIFPGLAYGSEPGWGGLAGDHPFPIADDHFKYVVFKDPTWDFRTFDFDKDVALADTIDNGSLNANDPNMKTFFGRGGKIVMYHGWIDQLISPQNSIDYFESVAAATGGVPTASESIRLFMVPGMSHCAGGPGATTFDALKALEDWVEQKKAPETLPASRVVSGRTERTHPLCPYPQVATYQGVGDPQSASSFTCR
jgi:feruloyl esterase